MKLLKFFLFITVLSSSIFAWSQDKAKIYVIRNSPSNPLSPSPVFIDGEEVGVNMGMTYLEKEVDAGSHTISGGSNESITVTVAAGETYYVQQKVVLGLLGLASKFKDFKPGKGPTALKRCKKGGPAGTGRGPKPGHPPIPPQ